MPKWDEYKQIARSRGALALELFVVNSTAERPQEIPEVLPDHLAYQAKLESEGKLAFAGPMSDPSGQEQAGDGMIIYRAASMEDARALAEADPMHAKGVRSFTLRKWLINEGSFTLNVGLSGKRVSLD